jgi:hypothetical protein
VSAGCSAWDYRRSAAILQRSRWSPRRSVAARLLPQRAKFDLRVNSTTAAFSAAIQGVSTQVTQLQADMDKVKEPLGIP